MRDFLSACFVRSHRLQCYYRQQTKLWEDNVFTHVCLFTGECIPACTWTGGVYPSMHLGRGVYPIMHLARVCIPACAWAGRGCVCGQGCVDRVWTVVIWTGGVDGEFCVGTGCVWTGRAVHIILECILVRNCTLKFVLIVIIKFTNFYVLTKVAKSNQKHAAKGMHHLYLQQVNISKNYGC